MRRDIAERTLSVFFSASSCHPAQLLGSWAGRDVLLLSDAQAIDAARSQPFPVGTVALIRIEELGPFVRLYLSPILWEGGTEIAFRVRLLNVSSGALVAEETVNWTRGGAFYLRGVNSLDEDLASALGTVFHFPGAKSR